MNQKAIAIIGATGSIGQSAAQILRQYPARFRAVLLAAGVNAQKLADLALEFKPVYAAIADEKQLPLLKDLLCGSGIECIGGQDALCRALARSGAGICLSAACGTSGLATTLTAIEAGMDVALANKESLVAAGEILMPLAQKRGVRILPVDSEHSALFQCLSAGRAEEVHRLIITASGGALRDLPLAELADIDPQRALAHPTWSMGRKITIDSATLANKALEVIEAHWLFGDPYERIEDRLHRQSIIHGLVEYRDGSLLAQMANPDMRLPILHALAWPQRLESGVAAPSLAQIGRLDFAAPDPERYPLLPIGLAAAHAGGLAPAVYSAANEEAVNLFLEGKVTFGQLADLVRGALAQVPAQPLCLESIIAAEKSARLRVRELAQT